VKESLSGIISDCGSGGLCLSPRWSVC